MIRLAVRVPRAEAELVLAELLELAPSGAEELELDGGLVEYALYGSPGELPTLPELKALVRGAIVEVSASEVHADWQERWKRFHKPVLIASPAPRRVPAIRVRPPWEQLSGLEGTVEIAIDPGRAFGTGSHATTMLCLQLLLKLSAERAHRAHARPSGSLLDVGTGSGVLAIAAAKLGYDPVLALDNDRESVAAARANAAANGVALRTRLFDLRHEALPQLPDANAAVILANLLRPLLLDLACAIEDPPQHLIAGGLLRAEVGEVTRAFAKRAGLRERARTHRGEWSSVWLERER